MRATTDYRQADDEMQKRREREQRKREPDKMPVPRAVSCRLFDIVCSVVTRGVARGGPGGLGPP